MESLILNGETWMEPLLKFRDILAETAIPENKDIYRNYKRRSGRVSYQYAKDGEEITAERKHVPGPYWLKYRQEWLRQLLQLDKQFKKEGREIELITVPELHAIRQHWLRDPNEPDWNDTLPQLFRDVYGYDLDWVVDDNASFGKVEAKLVNDLSQEFNISPEMVMKLIEMEISLDGLSRRVGVFDKLANILKQDWGSLEDIKVRHSNVQSRIELDLYKEQMDEYNKELAELDRLLSEEF